MAFKSAHHSDFHWRLHNAFIGSKQVVAVVDDYQGASAVTFEKATQPLRSRVAHLDEMIRLVSAKCQQPHDHLSTDESASIMLFTMEWTPREEAFHYIFDRALVLNDADGIQPWRLYVKLMSAALSKLPTACNRIFYREAPLNSTDKYLVGQSFFWPGFVSCSSSINSRPQNKLCSRQTGIQTTVMIYTNQGKTITQHAFSKRDNDIILPYNQQFHIVYNQISKAGVREIVLKDLSAYDPVEVIPLPAYLIVTPVVGSQTVRTFDLLFSRRMKKLTMHCELSLQGQNLTDDHLRSVVREVIGKRQCTWLSFRNNQITDRGVAILASGLTMNTTLESLHLSQNSITSAGVKRLTAVLFSSYSGLTFLSLAHNQIDDEGARCIAILLRINCSLADLWLSYNQISDRGLHVLTDVLTSKNSTLMQLYLQGNKLITGSGIQSVQLMILRNRTLNTLWLHDCSLSDESRKQLRQTVTIRDKFDLSV